MASPGEGKNEDTKGSVGGMVEDRWRTAGGQVLRVLRDGKTPRFGN